MTTAPTQPHEIPPRESPSADDAPPAHAAPTAPVEATPTPPDELIDESPDAAADTTGEIVAVESGDAVAPRAKVKLGLIDRLEAWVARLSARSHFWHRVCSMIWLPFAFRSGIRMKRLDDSTFAAELPFRRFNRNWYNAMAGAALLGNSEIAGGMYIFGVCGGEYTIVCKELSYKFLRPCFGPALYKITPREDIKTLIATGREFNITVEMDVIQQAMLPKAVKRLVKDKRQSLMAKMASRDRRVGRCTATFHVTPHTHQKAKRGHVRQVG